MPETEGQRQLLLHDQTAIITGAARGIGRAIALEMAREGAEVVLADKDEGGMDETERMINAPGMACLKVPTDIQDTDQIHRLVSAALHHFGRITILVNNA